MGEGRRRERGDGRAGVVGGEGEEGGNRREWLCGKGVRGIEGGWGGYR